MYRYLVLGTKSTESMLLLNVYITFLHLANAFAPSDFTQRYTLYQYVCSLGDKPMQNITHGT